jgi:Raf kinase inhibitor-like YbhB/YbcL family protein
MEIISPVFRSGGVIPPPYTCIGQNVNPPLNFLNAPPKTQSFALIMHDPDAPSGDYLHWLVWDIPPSIDFIGVNSVSVGAVQGQNDAGKATYMGPCPPHGTHRYVFDLYALDTMLNLPTGSTLDNVKAALAGHVIEQASLSGSFSAKA